jgi:hypothetical protein
LSERETAMAGQRRPSQRQLMVFLQYQCRLGYYFETLSVFDGTFYQEHYARNENQKLVIRASVN